MTPPRILVIEDDAGIRAMLERGLRLAGYAPSLAASLEQGRARWADGAPDAVLLDVMLPDGDGTTLLAERRDAGDRTPVIILTAREESELVGRGRAAGASAHLSKPFAYADLLATLARLVPQGPSGSGSSRGAPSGG